MTGFDLDALFDDPLMAARAHRLDGAGPVIGIIGAGVPVELIEGAGALAVRLKGGPPRATPRADQVMEDSCDAHLRRIMDRLLAGDGALFDAIIVSRSSEGQLQLFYLLHHLRDQGLALPPVWIFDLLQTPTDLTRRHVAARIVDLAGRLAGLPGATDPLPALARSIARRNEARALFRGICAARAHTGLDRLKLASAGQVVDTGTFAALIPRLRTTKTSGEPRIALSGATQDHDTLYRQIEGVGLIIAAEDHDWGARLYEHDVAPSPDPVDALARHLQTHTPGPRQMHPPPPEEMLPPGRPDGVIFAFDAHDDTLGWDYPGHRARLDAAGLPSLMLRAHWPADQIAAQLDQFRQTLPRLPIQAPA